ncbi:LysR family transcriptional regulator [Roseomonas sp. BN140053]|uniref:LysR family transcriptional regulator n=1 Tax=Roseomonas sp. BN140053 TaxID=3391898 RepID=UPI0039EBC3F4
MHFDLTDLRLFLHVVEAGSITAGATRAGLALASASTRVRGMEEQAGIPLLERGRRGVEPTPAGRTLLRHARLVNGQMERMRGEMGEYARGLRGHVRLLANTAAAAEFLPEILADFLRANLNVDVDLGERPSPEVARAVAEEEVEVGIAASHADFSGLEVLPFRTDRLVLVTPPDHHLAGRRQMTFAEALSFEFVGLSDESALGWHLAGHAARAGGRMRTRVRVRGLDTACRMVALGAGIAVVPEAAVRRWDKQGTLAMVRMDDPWAERQLMVIVRRLDALSPHARKLADHLARSPEMTSKATASAAR